MSTCHWVTGYEADRKHRCTFHSSWVPSVEFCKGKTTQANFTQLACVSLSLFLLLCSVLSLHSPTVNEFASCSFFTQLAPSLLLLFANSIGHSTSFQLQCILWDLFYSLFVLFTFLSCVYPLGQVIIHSIVHISMAKLTVQAQLCPSNCTLLHPFCSVCLSLSVYCFKGTHKPKRSEQIQ